MDKFTMYVLAMLMSPQGDPNKETTLWGIPFNIIGGAGAAKSARFFQIARALNMGCWPIYSSTKQPEHFSGVPVAGPAGFSIECILPQVISAIDARVGLIFLDEFNTAPNATQAALLSFVNERQAGEFVLPPKVRIGMAMNPPDIATNGQELSLPMVNRMGHYKYTNPTIKQWRAYMASLAPGGILDLGMPSYKDAEQQIKKTWGQHYSYVHNLTGEFLEANAGTYVVKDVDSAGKEVKREANKLYDEPEPDDPRAAHPFPTHRTWTLANFAVTGARCLELDGVIEIDLVASLVGEGLAVEWLSYMKKENLPKPQDALDGKWQIVKRMDIVRAVLGGAANFTVHQDDLGEKNRRAIQCWDLLKRCIDRGYSDIVVQPARVLIINGLDSDSPDPQVADAAEIVCAELNNNGMLDYILRSKKKKTA